MKKTLLFFVLGIAISTQSLMAQVPSYVPTNGLVGYWPFNGNANDESGNGNNGTVNGATLTNDRFGNDNSAFNFDNDYISLSQPFFNGSTNVNFLTYSIWFKCSQLPSSSTAYSLSTKEGFWRTIGLEINANGLVSYGGSQPNPQSYFGVSSQNSITLNQWNHIVVTFENSTLKLYLNGNLESTSVIQYSTLDYSYLALGNSTSTNLIGATNPVSPGLTNFTNGIIDDFGVWNRALTQQEITNLYNSSLPQSVCLLANIPTTGLVGYWPFCGNANDESGNGNNGTVNGASLTNDRNGDTNKAYSFNGVNNEIIVQDNNNLDFPNGQFTISVDIKCNLLGSEQAFVDHLDNGSPSTLSRFTLRKLTNNKVRFYIKDESSVFSTLDSDVILEQNVWYNITCTFNYSTQEMHLYINGVLHDGDLSYNNNMSIAIVPPGQLKFGRYGDADYFDGIIDNVGIWNRALTQQEITTMYNSVEVPTYSDTCNNVSGSLTQGLIGYWPFCGNANDDSGHGNNGNVNGNVQLTTDRFGNSNSAYIWQSPNSNSNDYIQLGNLNNQLSNKITLSCWILLNCSQSDNRIISTGEQGLIIYQVQNDNVLLKATFDPAGSIWPSNHLINKNEWHHIVFTADNNLNFSRFYVDGILTDSSTGTNGSLSNELWNIGRKSISSFDGFCGKIDDIGIWNRALTPSEVTQLFNQNQCFTNTTVTDTLVINVGQLSYTNPVAYANNITIFPNPTSTQVNISFNNITDLTGGNINIINSLGQQVATTPITLSGTSTTMSLDTWGGSGLYFVQILNAQGIVVDVKKIILQ